MILISIRLSSKKKLRVAQRIEIYRTENLKSFSLQNVLIYNKGAFWRKIAKFRKSKRKSKPGPAVNLENFTRCYGEQFSYCDLPNTVEHGLVKNKVEQRYHELKDQIYEKLFMESNIATALNKLESGKACGLDNISNEMLKYGEGPGLLSILATLYNLIVSTCYIPLNFNKAVVHVKPILKKGP